MMEERKVREFAGFELWLKGCDYAGICRVGDTPDYGEYSIPFLTKEWNRLTGDVLEEEFFQAV